MLNILEEAKENTGKYLIEGNFVGEHEKYCQVQGRYQGISHSVRLVEDLIQKVQSGSDEEEDFD